MQFEAQRSSQHRQAARSAEETAVLEPWYGCPARCGAFLRKPVRPGAAEVRYTHGAQADDPTADAHVAAVAAANEKPQPFRDRLGLRNFRAPSPIAP
jgi:hypothetical protein